MRKVHVVLAMLLATWPMVAAAAEVGAAEQRAIVAELQLLLRDKYVLTDEGQRYSTRLDTALRDGVFVEPKKESEFVALLNGLLQEAFPDRHLGVLTTERYAELAARFGIDNAADAEHAPPAQSNAHGGFHSAGHDADSASRESRGRVELRRIAGITRVSEINRDGFNAIGYIAFEEFIGSDRARSVVERILQTFTESDRLVIDLRDCRGGDADFVTFLSSQLLATPTLLVSTMVRDGSTTERWTTPSSLGARLATKKLDILISSDTFSAAESFAFGLHNVGRARLIGETTGGGGHMNDFFPLPSGLGVSISIGRTYDPRTGDGWQGTGVVPDIQIEKDHALSGVVAVISRESGVFSGMSAEQILVYKAIQDYADAWYRADAESMEGLIEGGFQSVYSGRNGELRFDHDAHLQATRDGIGKIDPVFRNRIIRELVVVDGRASVRLVLRTTYHDLKLVNHDGKWLVSSDESSDKPLHG